MAHKNAVHSLKEWTALSIYIWFKNAFFIITSSLGAFLGPSLKSIQRLLAHFHLVAYMNSLSNHHCENHHWNYCCHHHNFNPFVFTGVFSADPFLLSLSFLLQCKGNTIAPNMQRPDGFLPFALHFSCFMSTYNRSGRANCTHGMAKCQFADGSVNRQSVVRVRCEVNLSTVEDRNLRNNA